jgi:hypothetical protein
LTSDEEDALRRSVYRGTPWGSPVWQKPIAARLGIESSLRPRARPVNGKRKGENGRKKQHVQNVPFVSPAGHWGAALHREPVVG